MQDMPKIYEGNKPYIFVSYARADKDAVLPMTRALVAEGFRVWYDAGIEPAEPWTEYIANHVYGCACFVALISRASLASHRCMEETEYAHALDKTILPIYLQDVELTRGLQMSLGRRQALFWYEYDSDDAFYAKLFKARRLDPCLTDEGRRRRGVKPRGGRDAGPGGSSHDYGGEAIAFDTVGDLLAESFIIDNSDVDVVRPKAALADYSWAELKAIADKIAAAGDEGWLDVARSYGLVGADGKLQGATKEVVLGDITKAHVRIAGFRHDELASGGGRAGITFEFADVPVTHAMNPEWTNAGGWEGSEMRGWLSSGFLHLLPADLRGRIAEVSKLTNNAGKANWENDISVVTATSDKLWLLSMSEVCGQLSSLVTNVPPSPATYDAEGAQYQLYADWGVSTTKYEFRQKRGAHSFWWLRSPLAPDARNFFLICDDGGWIRGGAAHNWGVSPGFCF